MPGYPCCCDEIIADCADLTALMARYSEFHTTFAIKNGTSCTTPGECDAWGGTFVLDLAPFGPTNPPCASFLTVRKYLYYHPSSFTTCSYYHSGWVVNVDCESSGGLRALLWIYSNGSSSACTSFFYKDFVMPFPAADLLSGTIPLTGNRGPTHCQGDGNATYSFEV